MTKPTDLDQELKQLLQHAADMKNVLAHSTLTPMATISPMWPWQVPQAPASTTDNTAMTRSRNNR